ncbi:MAG TPA: ABC transporter ATP-binding protein [Acidobacteriota bacterium]
MIELRNITKRFQETTAVENVSFQIGQGEIFGLLGPNGAGKTTTVRILAGLLSPTSGNATVAGFPLAQHGQAARRSIGFLTEVPGFYDRLSAFTNLEFFGELYGIKHTKRQIQKYLELFGLWERRMDIVGTYSKGMKQKLALARALLHEPPVLLLDEPSAGLDPEMQKMVREFIAGLKSSQRAILMCTHNLDEAERLCDRIAVLKTKIVAIDQPADLRHRLFGHRIQIELNNAADPYAPLLRPMSFISSLDYAGRTIRISLQNPTVENPIVIRALVEAGAEIRYVREEQHSLEEIYLKLISEEKK